MRPSCFLSLTSTTLPLSRLYDVADSIIAQKIAQVSGVGQVNVNGGARPAVRIDLNPTVLANYGLSLEQVRTRARAVQLQRAQGSVSNGVTRGFSATTISSSMPTITGNLIIAYRNGAPVRLADVADVQDSVENLYTARTRR